MELLADWLLNCLVGQKRCSQSPARSITNHCRVARTFNLKQKCTHPAHPLHNCLHNHILAHSFAHFPTQSLTFSHTLLTYIACSITHGLQRHTYPHCSVFLLAVRCSTMASYMARVAQSSCRSTMQYYGIIHGPHCSVILLAIPSSTRASYMARVAQSSCWQYDAVLYHHCSCSHLAGSTMQYYGIIHGLRCSCSHLAGSTMQYHAHIAHIAHAVILLAVLCSAMASYMAHIAQSSCWQYYAVLWRHTWPTLLSQLAGSTRQYYGVVHGPHCSVILLAVLCSTMASYTAHIAHSVMQGHIVGHIAHLCTTCLSGSGIKVLAGITTTTKKRCRRPPPSHTLVLSYPPKLWIPWSPTVPQQSHTHTPH